MCFNEVNPELRLIPRLGAIYVKRVNWVLPLHNCPFPSPPLPSPPYRDLTHCSRVTSWRRESFSVASGGTLCACSSSSPASRPRFQASQLCTSAPPLPMTTKVPWVSVLPRRRRHMTSPLTAKRTDNRSHPGWLTCFLVRVIRLTYLRPVHTFIPGIGAEKHPRHAPCSRILTIGRGYSQAWANIGRLERTESNPMHFEGRWLERTETNLLHGAACK